MAMICASGSLKSDSMFVRPCPPQPTIAMLTFSLGATNPGPPSTCRGTRENTAAVPALARINRRRLNFLDLFIGFLSVAGRAQFFRVAKPAHVPDARRNVRQRILPIPLVFHENVSFELHPMQLRQYRAHS